MAGLGNEEMPTEAPQGRERAQGGKRGQTYTPLQLTQALLYRGRAWHAERDVT